MKRKIIIYNHYTVFTDNDGGIIVQYELAKTLTDNGLDVWICKPIDYPYDYIQNKIFNNFYYFNFPIDDNCIVIYCEGTIGNPLNAKYVVRWMLSELGQNAPYDWLHSWRKDELVYYFNTELKIQNNPEKNGTIYKHMNIIHVNPNAIIYNPNERTKTCYTIRKEQAIHRKKLVHIHNEESIEIPRHFSQQDCIEIFNNCRLFISHDPITFLYVISPLCGCVSLVRKIDGVSKEEWLKKTVCYEYFKYIGKYDLYGIAYGIEELPFAISTLHLVKQQWEDIVEYSKQHTIIPFINDIQNFKVNLNTIQNNFY